MSRETLVRRGLSTSAAVLLASAVAVVPALAQPAAAPAPMASGAAPQPSSAPSEAPRSPSAAATAPMAAAAHRAPTPDQVERRITALHRQLHITAAEQTQWDTFAQAMRDNAAHMQQVFAQQPNTTSVSALQDMRAYAAITEAQAQDMQNLLPAFEALYNGMTPGQKKTADDVFHQYARQRMAAERPTPRG